MIWSFRPLLISSGMNPESQASLLHRMGVAAEEAESEAGCAGPGKAGLPGSHDNVDYQASFQLETAAEPLGASLNILNESPCLGATFNVACFASQGWDTNRPHHRIIKMLFRHMNHKSRLPSTLITSAASLAGHMSKAFAKDGKKKGHANKKRRSEEEEHDVSALVSALWAAESFIDAQQEAILNEGIGPNEQAAIRSLMKVGVVRQ